MASYTVEPYPLAMVVCDSVHVDRGTGKYFLLGLFSTIASTDFPCQHPHLVVYTAVTDGIGTIKMRLDFVAVSDEEHPIASVEQEMQSEDPRITCEIAFEFKGLLFPEPGEYRFRLFANEEFLLERRILADLIPKKEDGHNV